MEQYFYIALLNYLVMAFMLKIQKQTNSKTFMGNNLCKKIFIISHRDYNKSLLTQLVTCEVFFFNPYVKKAPVLIYA